MADHRRRRPRSASTASKALAQFFADPTGLLLPIVNEELFWGDAGIGMSIMGTSLAVAAIFGQGTGEQIGEWIPQCFGTRRRRQGRRLLRLRAQRRLRRLGRAHDARSTTRPPTSGSSTARRRGPPTAASPTCTSSSPRSTASSARAATPPSSSRPARKGLEQGAKVKKHGLRASHTADVFLDDCRVPGACLLGGKEKLDERLARVREGTQRARSGRDADLRGLAPDRRRPGARASPAPPTSTRWTTPRSASSSAARSSRTRPSRSRWPT